MTQLKLRLTEADHLILKADLLLRVNHNESAQTKKENRKGESTSPKHPSVFVSGLGFLSHSRSELSLGDEADTIGLDQCFFPHQKNKNKKTWWATCGGVFIFIVWVLIIVTREYRERERHMVFISAS